MKKLFIIIGIMLIVAMAGFALVACSGGSSGGGGSDDTYYEVKGYGSSATLDESSWIKLKGGKWSDDDGESGTYKLDGNKITILQDGEELMTGTLKDGTIELEMWGMPAGTYRTKSAQEKISSAKSGDSNASNASSGGNGSSSGGNNSGSSGGQSGSNDKELEKQVVTKTLSLYNLDGSTTTKEIEVGKALGTLPSPTRNNYSFRGWENLDGDIYTSSSIMPSSDLELYPLWEKSVSSYSDSFISFSPARQGYKNELAFLHGSQYGAEKYLYVEITPEDLTGSIDTSNNFSLRNLKNLNYSVSAGYTAMWYQGNFNNPNGAQRFSLSYGSNIQLITVSDSGGTVQCTYLLDIYVLRNYTVSLYKTIYDNYFYNSVTVLEGDSLPITTRPTANGDLEFDRWVYYDGTTYRYKRFTYATEVTSNIRIYQAYKPCIATVELEGGTLEGAVEVEPYMDYVTLPIPIKTDYDFLGWKKADGTYFTNDKGSSQWSYYTSSMGTLTASWKKKVMYYSFADDVLTILPTEYNAVYLENGTISSMWYTVIVEDDTITVNSTNSADIGDEVTIAALTDGREGYTFLGWYENGAKVGGESTVDYTIILPANRKIYTSEWIKVEIVKNDEEAGNVTSLTQTYKVGDEVTVTATTNPGYTWLGWYDGETKVSEEASLTYTFTMTAESNTYMAKWMLCPVMLEKNISEAGSVSGIEEETAFGAETIITAITNPGYIFLGWYEGEEKLSESTSLTYVFIMSMERKTYTAKFALCSDHKPDENCICSKCGAEAHTVSMRTNGYCRHGNYIFFGEYPQTIKANSVTITDITDSRGYYLGSDGEYYAKVTATPYNSGYTFSTGSTVTSGMVYHFKVEPIKWRILSESDGEAFIVCDNIIANHRYSGYSNNYAKSEIRTWLNDAFYNTVFTDLQKTLILLTTVDNSERSANPNDNAEAFRDKYYFSCENTEDYVFLLSVQEVTTNYGSMGFSTDYSYYGTDPTRRMQTSDYSRATGAWMNTDSVYYGNGVWWLRSPREVRSNNPRYMRFIRSDGPVGPSAETNENSSGVVPALRIKL